MVDDMLSPWSRWTRRPLYGGPPLINLSTDLFVVATPSTNNPSPSPVIDNSLQIVRE